MLERLAALEGTGGYFQPWFDFRHITDELVFYGMKAQTSHFVSLPPTSRTRCSSAPRPLRCSAGAAAPATSRCRPAGLARRARELMPWVKQLSYFLNHFPTTMAASSRCAASSAR